MLPGNENPTTQDYVRFVFEHKVGEVAEFEVQRNMGEVIVQRVRVEVSRIKKRIRMAGQSIPHFKLLSTVTLSEDGERDVVKFKRVLGNEPVEIDLTDLEKMLIVEGAKQ